MASYIVNLNDQQEAVAQKMLQDKGYWPGGVLPRDHHQVVQWAIDDAIDEYVALREEYADDDHNFN